MFGFPIFFFANIITFSFKYQHFSEKQVYYVFLSLQKYFYGAYFSEPLAFLNISQNKFLPKFV